MFVHQFHHNYKIMIFNFHIWNFWLIKFVVVNLSFCCCSCNSWYAVTIAATADCWLVPAADAIVLARPSLKWDSGWGEFSFWILKSSPARYGFCYRSRLHYDLCSLLAWIADLPNKFQHRTVFHYYAEMLSAIENFNMQTWSLIRQITFQL